MRKTMELFCLLVMSLAVMVGSLSAQERRIVVIQSAAKGAPPSHHALRMTGPLHRVPPSPKTWSGLGASTSPTLMNTKLAPATTAAATATTAAATATTSAATTAVQSGTTNAVPYFTGSFQTGYQGGTYTYAMIGQPPQAGGITWIKNEIIPVVVALFNGHNKLLYIFDPTVAHDPQGSDLGLVMQSPIYDPTIRYPGNGSTLPADTGPFADTVMRASFIGVRTADWHTLLRPPTVPAVQYVLALQYANGDWACVGGEAPPCTSIPVVNIATLFSDFEQILAIEKPQNSTIPIVLTDYVVAYDPVSGNCCEVGNHTAITGVVDPTGPLVYVWATFLPQSNDPLAPGFEDVSILSHELTEAFFNPFLGNTAAPWVDGSVQFPQQTLEPGDVIERMAAKDAIYAIPRTPNGVPYTYHVQNEALLQWFSRTPTAPVTGPGPGVYSWPNTNTLNNGHNPAGPCGSLAGCWVYGEGPGGFLFGPPY